MIKKVDNRTLVIFGTGDIMISNAICEQDEVVILSQDEPGPIGFRDRPELVGKSSTELDQPIELIFTNTESIDVLIDALQEAKANTLNKISHE